MRLIKFGTILNSSCLHSYKQGSVTFTAASHQVAIKLFWLYFSGKAFWRSEGKPSFYCWHVRSGRMLESNKVEPCRQKQMQRAFTMNWFTAAWCFIYCCCLETDLCDIPSDPPLWPVQLMVKSWLFNKTACFFLCGWGLCTWQTGGSTNVMKLSIHMDHGSTLESIKLVMFNLKPLW